MSRSSSRRVVVRVVDHYDDKTRTKAAWFLLESSVASGDAEEKPAQKGTDFCFWVWVGSLQLELYWFCVFGLIGGGARKRWIDVQLDSRKRAHRSSLSAFTLTNRRNKRLNLSRS